MRAGIFGLAMILASCSDKTTEDDTGSPPGACDDAPVVTWNNFGQGFLIENCQSCHASTSPNRHDAPEAVVFDTLADVKAQKDRIQARALGEDPTMPPEGGVSDDDRALLQIWLDCWLDQEEG